jgi:hypothetical protein
MLAHHATFRLYLIRNLITILISRAASELVSGSCDVRLRGSGLSMLSLGTSKLLIEHLIRLDCQTNHDIKISGNSDRLLCNS